MALITDPDSLTQDGGGAATVSDGVITGSSGSTATLTSVGSEIPLMSANDYIVISGFTKTENNGLWQVTGTPAVGSTDLIKISGADPSDETTASIGLVDADMEVYIDIGARELYLFTQGNLTNDGVTLQALYSFLKEEWKTDANLIPHPFPMVAITPEQFEFAFDWNPADVTTRKLIRTGGWSEVDSSGVLQRQYAGVITLGSFEDSAADTAYYAVGNDPTDTSAAIDFDFAGPVNEAILTYYNVTPADAGTGFAIATSNTISRNDGGNWATDGYVVGGEIVIANAEDSGNDGSWVITSVTDGVDGDIVVTGTPLTNNADDVTMTAAFSYRNAVSLFLRVRDGDDNGKVYAQSNLAAIGVTALVNKVERFPLSNATDLKISSTDGTIEGGGPWTEISVRYFDQAFAQDIGATPRSFGIVVDVGTISGVDGDSDGSATFTSAEGGLSTTWDGGTLTIHEGPDAGEHAISSSTATTFVLSSALTGTESNLSFTAQRSTPVVATTIQIYEKVQYLLRQALDIDSTDQTVAGDTADALLEFVGDTLKTGSVLPTNPNGGGSGVAILGFDSNDTNDLVFVDNTGNERTFPFVAAGTISFNANLVSDTDPEYWMFYAYTERFNNAGFGTSSSSGSEATIDSSVTDLTAELSAGDYIALTGFANEENNGIWELTGAPAGSSPWTVTARKADNLTVVDEGEGASVTLDKNPINSPDAIIVQNNSDADIAASVPGATTSFDYDYDGNVQGGRSAGTEAAVVLRAIGLETGQFVETSGTITRATGLAFSLVAALERNYSNP